MPRGRIWSAARRRLRTVAASTDAGFTMVEMIVGMVIMTLFMGMFTTAIGEMFTSTSKAQSLNNSSAQLNLAFDQLDREVRYASYVSVPAQETSGDWIVSLQTTNTGTPVCTQLRVDIASQQLQQRTWTVVGSPPSSTASQVTAWVPLASGVTNGNAAAGSANQPFTMTPPSSAQTSAQLTIVLVAANGSGRTVESSQTSITFTALNTTLTTPTSGLCGEVTSP